MTSFQRVSLVFRARGLRVDAIKKSFRDLQRRERNAPLLLRVVRSDLVPQESYNSA